MNGRAATQVSCAHCDTLFHPRYNSKGKYCSSRCAGLAKVKVKDRSPLTVEERAVAAETVAAMEDALARLQALLGPYEDEEAADG
ncbi:hypothetical protein [Microbacterium sp. LWO13-1.2]|uniref:hypothetical protein n=1 Tax=Microbacterium sp. LWO13-1.2 TaxID=3135262 RepID=UPI003138AB85